MIIRGLPDSLPRGTLVPRAASNAARAAGQPLLQKHLLRENPGRGYQPKRRSRRSPSGRFAEIPAKGLGPRLGSTGEGFAAKAQAPLHWRSGPTAAEVKSGPGCRGKLLESMKLRSAPTPIRERFHAACLFEQAAAGGNSA